jgi:hypothetical protein
LERTDGERVPLPYVENRPFDALEHSFFDAGEALEQAADVTSMNGVRQPSRRSWVLVPALGCLLLFGGVFFGSKTRAGLSQVATAEAAIPLVVPPVVSPTPALTPVSAPIVASPTPVAHADHARRQHPHRSSRAARR